MIRNQSRKRGVLSWLRAAALALSVIVPALPAPVMPVWAQTTTPNAQQQANQPPAGAPAVTTDPGYQLGSGDRVRITVFGQPDLSGEYAIDGSGILAFPLIGQLKAGGHTAHELEQQIIGKLKPNYLRDPRVAIEVLTYRPFYIVGEVKTPGSYPYVNGMTVLNAVALAGGFTYRAREESFYVTRTQKDGSKSRVDAAPDTQVFPGDVITVRERYF
jgi:polysaccharide export outer membrane protein